MNSYGCNSIFAYVSELSLRIGAFSSIMQRFELLTLCHEPGVPLIGLIIIQLYECGEIVLLPIERVVEIHSV